MVKIGGWLRQYWIMLDPYFAGEEIYNVSDINNNANHAQSLHCSYKEKLCSRISIHKQCLPYHQRKQGNDIVFLKKVEKSWQGRTGSEKGGHKTVFL
ncbi:hypothetical protein C5167_003617 [Papaver somniferum]|uniref:Uncharacterized protein n=1 Tax=Papaver somniferum TaxID=3469 RepID=A0A4Y7L573_PAPSO|nr:hypothetical protein C5167_003617 [Papaver somniferum]